MSLVPRVLPHLLLVETNLVEEEPGDVLRARCAVLRRERLIRGGRGLDADVGSVEGDTAAVHRPCERDAFTGGEFQPEQDATVPFPLRDLLELLGAEDEIDRIDDE